MIMKVTTSLIILSALIAAASGRPQLNSPQQSQQQEQYKINGGAFTLPDNPNYPGPCADDLICQRRCNDPQEHINNGASPEDAPYFAANLQGTCNYNGLPGCRCYATTNEQCARIYICTDHESGCAAPAILVQDDHAFCQCPGCTQDWLGVGPEIPPGSGQ
ncbi:hypothetical protein B0J12DRAFT_336424 [Macrophomina phaseolina]|uniref:Uncharacterized protein n=1 Tax=Macrophomina phaseolina TaxID=35725 RepID=A0ABQ8GPH8_9PEZI|nr:hypothetical protein B0J12DRAFT_336424 [Macrophomina phaseolina]